MAPDISAETGLGASGCAFGSQTWKGTTPAFEPKPTRASRKTSPRTPGERCRECSAMAANDCPSACAAKTKNPTRIRAAPTWVSTAYQEAALWTGSLRQWSTSTSASDVNAISSHSIMKVATLPALGTRRSVVTKIGNTHAAVRLSRPCARVSDAVQGSRYRHHGHEEHEERAQRIEHKVDAGKGDQLR